MRWQKALPQPVSSCLLAKPSAFVVIFQFFIIIICGEGEIITVVERLDMGTNGTILLKSPNKSHITSQITKICRCLTTMYLRSENNENKFFSKDFSKKRIKLSNTK